VGSNIEECIFYNDLLSPRSFAVFRFFLYDGDGYDVFIFGQSVEHVVGVSLVLLGVEEGLARLSATLARSSREFMVTVAFLPS